MDGRQTVLKNLGLSIRGHESQLTVFYRIQYHFYTQKDCACTGLHLLAKSSVALNFDSKDNDFTDWMLLGAF